MKIGFNNNLEALYGIDYCINRDRNVIKQDESENNSYFDDLYHIYLERVPDEVRNDVSAIGDYRHKAEYALNGFGELPDLSPFTDYLDGNKDVQNRIISDIKDSEGLKLLNLDQKKDFLGINPADEIDVLLSLFINGGFGVFNGSSNIILGVKYDPNSQKYNVSENLAEQIYHDFTYPYVQMLLEEQGIRINSGGLSQNSEGYLEEIITRVLEIVFASQNGDASYLEEKLKTQDGVGLGQVRIFLSEYLENKQNITNLRDYVDMLVDKGLVVKIPKIAGNEY